ncbi:HD domain-containing protein [bacterium]|nr:HD domain-containing protein [bacterium]
MKSWQKKLIKIVNPLLKKLEPDHGSAHAKVVFKWCLIFAKDYHKVDIEVLFAAAWLHDLGHLKLKNGMGGHSYFSVNLAGPILKKAGAPEKKFSLIKQIIMTHEEREDLFKKKLPVEVLIFHDADKIDGVGALGLARQFVYSGRVGKKFWDPNIPRDSTLPWGGNISAMHTILDDQLIFKFYTKKAKKWLTGEKNICDHILKGFFKSGILKNN